MILEFHDGELWGKEEGTLTGRVGHQGGIDSTYQTEMWIQDACGRPHSPIRRVYALTDLCRVAAIWSRDEHGTMRYVARSRTYNGAWQLPYHYCGLHEVAITVLGREFNNPSQGEAWADRVLNPPFAAAVLLGKDRSLLAAWERGAKGVFLVARGRGVVFLPADTEGSLLGEFRDHQQNPPTDLAKKILFGIFHNLAGRSGLDRVWGGFDDNHKERVLRANLDMIRKNLP